MSNWAYRKQENCNWKRFYRFNSINVCARSCFFIVFSSHFHAILIFNGLVLFGCFYSLAKAFAVTVTINPLNLWNLLVFSFIFIWLRYHSIVLDVLCVNALFCVFCPFIFQQLIKSLPFWIMETITHACLCEFFG